MLPGVFGPFRGRAQGRAQGRGILTRSEGGVSRNRGGARQAPPFLLSPALFGFFVLDRKPRAAPAERGRRERPPSFDRWRGQSMGGASTPVSTPASTPTPLRGGSLPSVFILAGRLPGPRAGRTIRPTETPHA